MASADDQSRRHPFYVQGERDHASKVESHGKQKSHSFHTNSDVYKGIEHISGSDDLTGPSGANDAPDAIPIMMPPEQEDDGEEDNVRNHKCRNLSLALKKLKRGKFE